MILTVKNLQQQTFTIDFDPEKTVLELKKQILIERGAEYLVEKQKLIYAGVILSDERTVGSYKIDDKKFIVVMLTRDVSGPSSSSSSSIKPTTDAQRKQANKESTTESATKVEPPAETKVAAKPTEASAEKGTKTNTTTTEASTTVEAPTTTAPPAAAPSADYSSIDLVGELANATLQTRAESNLLMGEEYNRTVASMVEMGYAREQVERAMAASYNNPERAVEYLINGLPLDDEESPRARQGGPSDVPAESAADPFEFLRSQPQFLQMRSLIYQNPHLLHAVLQQIGQTNPALLQLISENQDAFLNMLNQPLDDEDNTRRTPASNPRSTETLSTSAIQEVLAEGQRAAAGSESQPIAVATSEGDGGSTVAAERNVQPETPGTIRLTPQDQDAIERLKALGFPEALVLQAYFACEKDEELAANFLLSSSFDD